MTDLSPCCQAGNITAYTVNNLSSLNCFTADYSAHNPQCGLSIEAIKCCECCYQGIFQVAHDKECTYKNAVGECRIITELCCQNKRSVLF